MLLAPACPDISPEVTLIRRNLPRDVRAESQGTAVGQIVELKDVVRDLGNLVIQLQTCVLGTELAVFGFCGNPLSVLFHQKSRLAFDFSGAHVD